MFNFFFADFHPTGGKVSLEECPSREVDLSLVDTMLMLKQPIFSWKFEWQKRFMDEGRASIDKYLNFIDQLMATLGSSVLKTKIF